MATYNLRRGGDASYTLESAMATGRYLLHAAVALCALALCAGGIDASGAGCRKHVARITEYGGVGDGKTLNTEAFAKAVADLSRHAGDGGAALVVPRGKWLTGPFNLTSHFTLFLDEGAEILASQDMKHWPLIAPLPSYGRGRDEPGPRYSNFIAGSNLTDVIITGKNGTVNGQGQVWWDKYHAKELKYTIISNVTFVDSPSWNLHPTYCTNVTISGVTILAPVHSPNTDGIDPDSSSHVKIEDCYIVSGDDCIAVKSGWDQYGIKFNMPSQHIVIKRLTCVSPTSAMIALGSEMSGGIRDVRAEDNTAINTESAVRVKSGVGRGGFVKDIFVRGLSLHTMKWVFWMTGNYGQHPDNSSNPSALPEVTGINYRDVFAENVTMAGRMEGIPNDPYTGICISNVTAQLAPNAKKLQWNCTDVKGVTSDVSPKPCQELGAEGKPCAFPEEELVIGPPELPKCSY
ncbi:probable polygalacturonase isoform X2 [Phragmites australis]|uniref:probable polygalacturonase isoform X2 n=1 Tax=Phragmites australis TaxID=29695 RepID=UPI002D79270F|nr:probable polygalacturonase isoform X2 [Phragmites australis]